MTRLGLTYEDSIAA
jgi:hypothetical protein